jgi:hypothetical protein
MGIGASSKSRSQLQSLQHAAPPLQPPEQLPQEQPHPAAANSTSRSQLQSSQHGTPPLHPPAQLPQAHAQPLRPLAVEQQEPTPAPDGVPEPTPASERAGALPVDRAPVPGLAPAGVAEDFPLTGVRWSDDVGPLGTAWSSPWSSPLPAPPLALADAFSSTGTAARAGRVYRRRCRDDRTTETEEAAMASPAAHTHTGINMHQWTPIPTRELMSPRGCTAGGIQPERTSGTSGRGSGSQWQQQQRQATPRASLPWFGRRAQSLKLKPEPQQLHAPANSAGR